MYSRVQMAQELRQQYRRLTSKNCDYLPGLDFDAVVDAWVREEALLVEIDKIRNSIVKIEMTNVSAYE